MRLKKIIIGLISLISLCGIMFFTYNNSGNFPVGRIAHHEQNFKTIFNTLEIKPSFGDFASGEEAMQAMNDGKIEIAYGDFYADVNYFGFEKSKSFKTCEFGIIKQSNENSPKSIGYTHDFIKPTLTRKYIGVKLHKFKSLNEMKEAMKNKTIDAMVSSDYLFGKCEKDLSFTSLGVKKNLVFIIKKNNTAISIEKLDHAIDTFLQTLNNNSSTTTN